MTDELRRNSSVDRRGLRPPMMTLLCLTVLVGSLILCASSRAYPAMLLHPKVGDEIQTPVTGMMIERTLSDENCAGAIVHRLLYVFPSTISSSNENPTRAVVFTDPKSQEARLVLVSEDGQGDDLILFGDKTGKGKITHTGTPGDAVFGDSVCHFLYGQ